MVKTSVMAKIAALMFSISLCGCGGGGEAPTRSPTADSDPERAARAASENDAFLKQRQEEERAARLKGR